MAKKILKRNFISIKKNSLHNICGEVLRYSKMVKGEMLFYTSSGSKEYFSITEFKQLTTCTA